MPGLFDDIAPEKNSLAGTVTAKAKEWGIDPMIAMRVFRSEGPGSTVDYMQRGDGGLSGGPFQLYTGGGVGNRYEHDTGHKVTDPSHMGDYLDYTFKEVRKGGWQPWHGASRVGITGTAGVGPMPKNLFDDIPVEKGAKGKGLFDDIPALPMASEPLGPNRPPGPMDPEIAAHKSADAPTGYFAPEQKVWQMLKSDPAGTLHKIGAATVEEAKGIVGQLSPTHLAQLAHQVGQETAANTATPETAGDVANLAQLGLKGAPGGRMGMPGRAVVAEKPAVAAPEAKPAAPVSPERPTEAPTAGKPPISIDELERQVQALVASNAPIPTDPLFKPADKPPLPPFTPPPLSPLAKFYDDLAKTGTHAGHLPMDMPSRIARAKQQGYNTKLTLFHGTGSDFFTKFKVPDTSEPAVFLTNDPGAANAYSDKGSGGAGIIPIWAKIENPKTVSFKGEKYSSSKMSAAVKQARADGHDVLIVKGVKDIWKDPQTGASALKPQTQYAFFKPENLRAKYGAAFDPDPASYQKFGMLGAQAVPTHDVLAQNVRNKEATMASADPTLRQKMRAATNLLKAFTAPETMRNIETGEQTGLEAAATIRKFRGRAEREQQVGAQALNQYYKTFNGVTPEEGLTVLRWLQEPSTRGLGGYLPIPEVEGFMRAFSDEMVKVRRKMESLPKTQDMEFKENFVSQMWQNPNETMAKLKGHAPKGGSGYFTKKSVWDSYEEGIHQGGIPLSTNPLEIGVRYLENAHRWLAENQILDEGGDTGRVVWRNQEENIPGGWQELKGRASYYKGPNYRAYAPPEYAEVYNNYVSTLPQGAKGDVIQAIQRVSNIITMAKLSLSYFHAGLMMNESMASGFANAIDNLAGGKVLTALWKTAEAPIYPLTSLWRARQGIKEYLDQGSGSPKLTKAMNALVDANFRVRGKGNIADEYRATFLPTFWESWRKGRLMMEARQLPGQLAKHPIKTPANLALRALESFMAPVFQYMVPRLKTGAAIDMMLTYLRRHPEASDTDLAAYARRVSNTIDDRFGEMNHDNIFLSRTQKSVMQSALVSYSYTYGSMRLAAGAGIDAAKIAKGGWTPRMSNIIGLAMSAALGGAIYQYLMTGKPPGSIQDLRRPQTGGTDERSGLPARAVLPSQLNSLVNMYNDPFGEMGNKTNEFIKGIWRLSSAMGPTGGYDWNNDPIVDKNDPVVQQLIQAGQYAAREFLEPMNMSTQPQEGSRIGGVQRFFGARDASRKDTDPQGSADSLHYVNAKRAVEKRLRDEKRYVPPWIKSKMIRAEMNKYGGVQ